MSDITMETEVIANILSRLPVKPLLQYRCVSKPWLALIDSSDFINLHLNRSIETNANHCLIFRDGDLYSTDFDSLDRAVKLDHPSKSKEYRTRVVGSCNGLLCLIKSLGTVPLSTDEIILWNFSTGKQRKLPVAPIKLRCELSNCSFMVYGFGFGYDSVHDDYKLVQHYARYDNSFYSGVRVFSLKSNSWRTIRDSPYNLPYNPCLLQNGVFVRGALHWVVCGGEPRSDKPNLIVAFDLGVEEYRLVPQPDYLVDKDFLLRPGSLGGCLCINCNYDRNRVDIWVMNEYGVKESWTKLFSVEKLGYVRPLAYSRTAEKVLLDQAYSKLFWFDLKRKTVENVRIPGSPTFFDDSICVGSLVPL